MGRRGREEWDDGGFRVNEGAVGVGGGFFGEVGVGGLE